MIAGGIQGSGPSIKDSAKEASASRSGSGYPAVSYSDIEPMMTDQQISDAVNSAPMPDIAFDDFAAYPISDSTAAAPAAATVSALTSTPHRRYVAVAERGPDGVGDTAESFVFGDKKNNPDYAIITTEIDPATNTEYIGTVTGKTHSAEFNALQFLFNAGLWALPAGRAAKLAEVGRVLEGVKAARTGTTLYSLGGVLREAKPMDLALGALTAVGISLAVSGVPDRVVKKITRQQSSFPGGMCTIVRTGQQIPVGTLGYHHDILPATTTQHGVVGSHYNLFVATYNPATKTCYWSYTGAAAKSVPPGSIPIEPIT